MSGGHNVDQVDGYQQGLTFAMTRLGENCDGVATAEQALANFREELEMQYAATLKWEVVDVNLDKFHPDNRVEAERTMQYLRFQGARITPTLVLRNVCGQLVHVRKEYEEFANLTGERIDGDVARIHQLCYAVRFLRSMVQGRMAHKLNTIEDSRGQPIDLDELLVQCEPTWRGRPPIVEACPELAPHGELKLVSSSPAEGPPGES